jgi:hypothetical protein
VHLDSPQPHDLLKIYLISTRKSRIIHEIPGIGNSRGRQVPFRLAQRRINHCAEENPLEKVAFARQTNYGRFTEYSAE